MTRQEIKDRLIKDFGTLTMAAAVAGLKESHLTVILQGKEPLVLARLGLAVKKWHIPVDELAELLSEKDRAALPQLREALRDS